MNENHELQQESDKMPIENSPIQISESSIAAQQPKFNPRFVGVILAILIPGAAHVLSGHWKAGLSWFLSFLVIAVFLSYVLSYPHHLSSTIIVGIELLSIIYFVSLLISSYRPTKKLGCSGWCILFLFFILYENIIYVPASFLVQTYIGTISRTDGTSMFPTIQSRSWYNTDRLITNRWVCRFSPPCRGDVVRIWEELEPGKKVNSAKRVVGLPGETIDIKTPYVFINGKKLQPTRVKMRITNY